MLKIYIPDSQYEEGGKFYPVEKRHAQVVIGLSNHNSNVVVVAENPVYLEDWQFHPKLDIEYGNILRMVNSGILVIERDGVIQTSSQLITLFRDNYQEL